ncbi:MAG TPA: tRNA uracil 4-sulfurtransferase ThiI [Actinomycetota bacterium]|nr:tRNA uracil 4-sulfurtransferase ThiI [Actinomycetota bacterium]
MRPQDALIVHYHELGLKGRNRQFFEQALVRNLKRALRGTGYARVRRLAGRVLIDMKEESDPQEAFERAARVFGLAYVGLGVRVSPEIGEVGDVALEMMQAEPFDSFRVRARRAYSTMEETSNTINNVVGQRIVDATGGRVDLKNADATAWVELFDRTGIVYRKRLEGPGGLPVGVSGRMLALLSGGIDSPVAAWKMARRGAEVDMLHFHGRPFTDPSSVRQALELAHVLTRYQLRTVVHLVPLGDVQREIVTHSPAPLRVVLYRRTMMRIAAELARQTEAQALITGDSLGQVASQTIENISTVDSAIPGVEVMRPLIGMDKREIVDDAKQIGTYEISTRKYQDCCVLFEPRSPATRANRHIAEQAESDLDIDALVGKALAGIETQVLELPDP